MGSSILPEHVVDSVISIGSHNRCIIACWTDDVHKKLICLRVNGDLFSAPFSWFAPRDLGPLPDFSDIEIIDYGQTVRLGHYDVLVKSMIDEFC